MSTIKDTDGFINEYQPKILKRDRFHAFLLGNCYLRKKDFASAQKYYQLSIDNSLKKPQFWRNAGLPQWLVDTLILSKNFSLLEKVNQALHGTLKEPLAAESPITWYTLAITSFLRMSGEADVWVDRLLEKPKYKYTYVLGKILRAVRERDEDGFNLSLARLLKMHEGQAKHGALRETPEGLICMPAMSVVYIALRSGIAITVNSEYIVPEYFADSTGCP